MFMVTGLEKYQLYRWPYDYSKPGKEKDFVPQTVPLDDNEEEH